jgi:predicted O-methyltransferase YrrM
MANRTLNLDERLYAYLRNVSVREHPVLGRLREETSRLPMAMMQIGPEQGQFMGLLVRLIGARRCLEIGTFTGYSALACALALPADGRLIALDVSEEWTSIARRFWADARVDSKIELRLGPALESLQKIVDGGGNGSFDFIFVDADKSNYGRYVEFSANLLRTGGLLAIDNVLWGGRVADPAVADADTAAIRAVNEAMFADQRFDATLVPIGDGLTLARRR